MDSDHEGTALHEVTALKARIQRWISGLVGRPAFWIMFVLFAGSWPVIHSLWGTSAPGPVPILGVVPAFTLRGDAGQTFDSGDLRGMAWVASAVCAGCAEVPPGILDRMSAIQHRSRNIAQAFRMVSFSVTPERDHTDVLAKLAREHHARPLMWTLLTGSKEQLGPLLDALWGHARGSAIGAAGALLGAGDARMLVLVDGRGRIRGRYDGREDSEIDRLLRDAALILARRR